MSLFQRSGMWREVSPSGAITDLITVFKEAGPNRWRFAVLAALPPLGMLSYFVNEEFYRKPDPPKIDYITTFDPTRSEAEIVASNTVNQKRKERLAAEQAKREEEVRQIYKSLGRLSGLDVDAIEKKAMAERAAQEQREKAEADKLRRLQQIATGKAQ